MVIDSKDLVSKAEVKTEELIFRLFAQEIADIRTFECIQAAVIAVCILGEKIIKILESENVSSELVESWFLEYFDYLSSRSLFIQKTLISRKCPIANIRELLYKMTLESLDETIMYMFISLMVVSQNKTNLSSSLSLINPFIFIC